MDGAFDAFAFQSTRPMRGATLSPPEADLDAVISIHAPHAGRDNKQNPKTNRYDISIHAPHAGRD